jgi:predicted 3-demethylubiquinone-9 3-methyltransferase (glyoxalase superfamily)
VVVPDDVPETVDEAKLMDVSEAPDSSMKNSLANVFELEFALLGTPVTVVERSMATKNTLCPAVVVIDGATTVV